MIRPIMLTVFFNQNDYIKKFVFLIKKQTFGVHIKANNMDQPTNVDIYEKLVQKFSLPNNIETGYQLLCLVHYVITIINQKGINALCEALEGKNYESTVAGYFGGFVLKNSRRHVSFLNKIIPYHIGDQEYRYADIILVNVVTPFGIIFIEIKKSVKVNFLLNYVRYAEMLNALLASDFKGSQEAGHTNIHLFLNLTNPPKY